MKKVILSNTKIHLLFVVGAMLTMMSILFSSCYKVSLRDTQFQVKMAMVAEQGTAYSSPPYAFAGDTVRISAIAKDNYHFTKWKVITQGFTLDNATITANPASFVMPAKALLIQGVFDRNAPNTYTLTLNTAEGGTIKAYSDNSYTPAKEISGTALNNIAAGTTIYLQTTPANIDIETTNIAGADSYTTGNIAQVTINGNTTITPAFATKANLFTVNSAGSSITSYTGSGGIVLIPTSIRGTAITTIEDGAFLSNTTITCVTIPNSITSIGYGAFFGCSGLTCVTIPNSVTSIGDDAFLGCSNLTNITIPNSVTSIGGGAFYGCTALTNIGVDASNTHYVAVGGVLFNYAKDALIQYPLGNTTTTYTIPNSVTSIGAYAFSGCSGLTSVTIPNGVTSIGGGAFFGCSNLTSITIPNSVTSIGGYTFSGCSGLTSVTIPNSVTSIGGYAFQGCSGLTGVTIPNSVTSIGKWAFEACSRLSSIRVEATTPPALSGGAFSATASGLSITVPSAVVDTYKAATNWSVYSGKISGY